MKPRAYIFFLLATTLPSLCGALWGLDVGLRENPLGSWIVIVACIGSLVVPPIAENAVGLTRRGAGLDISSQESARSSSRTFLIIIGVIAICACVGLLIHAIRYQALGHEISGLWRVHFGRRSRMEADTDFPYAVLAIALSVFWLYLGYRRIKARADRP